MAYKVYLKGGNVADVNHTNFAIIGKKTFVFYSNPETPNLQIENKEIPFETFPAFFEGTEVQGIVKVQQ